MRATSVQRAARLATAALLSGFAGACGPGGATHGQDAGPDSGAPLHGILWPAIPYNGGPVLSPTRLVTLIQPSDPLGPQLASFSAGLFASQWWSSFAPDYGLLAGSHWEVPAPDMDAGTWTSDELTAYVQRWYGDGGMAPDGKTLYLVYLPSDVTFTIGGASSCSFFWGVHFPLPSAADSIAVVARCFTQDVDGGLSILDNLTATASHEIAEAASDPVGNGNAFLQGVIADGASGGEIGDLCAGNYIRETGYALQRIWSRTAAAAAGDPCVPAQSGPYFNLSAPQTGWFVASAGQSVNVPLKAYGAGQTQDWAVAAFLGDLTAPPDSGFALSLSSPVAAPAIPPGFPPILRRNAWAGANDGVQVSLTVTVPANAKSSDYAVVQILSFQPSWFEPWGMESGAYALGTGDTDTYHSQWIGVYVP